MDAPFYDLASTIDPPKPAGDVVIVAIDEPSFAEIGWRWPWPRDLHARLAVALRDAGAKAVGFDMIFAEPSTPEADGALAAALGQSFVLASDETRIETPHASQTIRVEPLPDLVAGGASSGVVTITLDPDGVLRRTPDVDGGFARTLLAKADPATRLDRTEGLVRFRGGPRSYATLSYYQALDPKAFLPPGAIAGKVVLVGLSLQSAADASAGAADAFATPFTTRDRRLLSGVEAQATLFDALRAQDLVASSPYAAQVAAALAAALAGAAIGLRGVSWRGAAGAIFGAVAIVAAAWIAFQHGGVWLSPAPSALALIVTVGATAGLDYARERRARREIMRAFGQYVAPEVVQRLAQEPEALKLGGERRVLTVLFCDIRGFTELAERMKTDPERLTSLINRLLGPLSDAVLAEGGTIDKYIGDCVMAFWNAPLPVHDHAERAVRAGLAMLAAVERLNAELLAEAGPAVAPLEFAVGIGINTGECVVGNLGSERRFDYTAVGDTVNLASRLEGASQLYGVPMLVGADTARSVVTPLIELDRLAVKGRRDGVAVFAALAGRAEPPAQATFLSAYRARRWDEAEAALADVARDEPRLAFYARAMTERVAAHRAVPPDVAWSGVFAADRK